MRRHRTLGRCWKAKGRGAPQERLAWGAPPLGAVDAERQAWGAVQGAVRSRSRAIAILTSFPPRWAATAAGVKRTPSMRSTTGVATMKAMMVMVEKMLMLSMVPCLALLSIIFLERTLRDCGGNWGGWTGGEGGEIGGSGGGELGYGCAGEVRDEV